MRPFSNPTRSSWRVRERKEKEMLGDGLAAAWSCRNTMEHGRPRHGLDGSSKTYPFQPSMRASSSSRVVFTKSVNWRPTV